MYDHIFVDCCTAAQCTTVMWSCTPPTSKPDDSKLCIFHGNRKTYSTTAKQNKNVLHQVKTSMFSK